MPLQRDSLTTYIIFIFPLFVLALWAVFDMATKPSNSNLNGELLDLFSKLPSPRTPALFLVDVLLSRNEHAY